MKRIFVTSAVILSLLFPGIAFSDDSEVTYSDLANNHVYKDAIMYMTEQGHVEGYDDGTFKPEDPINRAEALKVIMNVSKIEDEEIGSEDIQLAEVRLMEFPDLTTDAWYYSHIEEAYQNYIVDGHDDGTFKPEDTVSRAEALEMFFQARNVQFDTSEETDWYAPYIEFASEKSLIVPEEFTYQTSPEVGASEWITEWDYMPGEDLSRGELCDIVYRFFNAPFTGQTEFGVASYYGYSFDGANTASGTALEAYGYMAAHKTLPFGTWVRITNIENNTYIDVEIVDRGPYVEGRIIDLTPGAFEEIGELWQGVVHTRMEVLK